MNVTKTATKQEKLPEKRQTLIGVVTQYVERESEEEMSSGTSDKPLQVESVDPAPDFGDADNEDINQAPKHTITLRQWTFILIHYLGTFRALLKRPQPGT